MNNLTLGNADFSYYETLGGGQGACPDADGPSAVHVAMSNTLNTPIEALEREFPLRVVEYALRAGLGRRRGPPGRRRPGARDPGPHRDDLLADRRAPAPPPARRERAAAHGAAGRDTLDGRPIPGKSTALSAPGSGCASKPQVEEDSEMPEQQTERIGFLGLGIMGSRMAANLVRAGFQTAVWTHTPRQGRELGPRESAAAHATPAQVAASRATSSSAWSWTASRCPRSCSARTAWSRRPAPGAVRGHVDDRAAGHPCASGPSWPSAA